LPDKLGDIEGALNHTGGGGRTLDPLPDELIFLPTAMRELQRVPILIASLRRYGVKKKKKKRKRKGRKKQTRYPAPNTPHSRPASKKKVANKKRTTGNTRAK